MCFHARRGLKYKHDYKIYNRCFFSQCKPWSCGDDNTRKQKRKDVD